MGWGEEGWVGGWVGGGEYYSEQGDEQHHEHEFYGTNEVSGEFQDKETMLGDSKEQKSQNVKEDDIYQLSEKSVSNMKESTSIVGNFSKSVETEIQIVAETVAKKLEEKVAVKDIEKNEEVLPNTEQPRMLVTSDYLLVEQHQAVYKPEEAVAVEDTNKNDEVLPNNKQPSMILTSDYWSGEQYQASQWSSEILTPDIFSGEQYQARQQASKTGKMQPESLAVVSDSLSKFPEPEKLDPPDRLTIPIVCPIEDEAQHVPPVQHSLEAEDLAEAQCVHPVLDADQST